MSQRVKKAPSLMNWEAKQQRLMAMLEEVISDDDQDNVAVESYASIDDDDVQISDHNPMSEQDVSSLEESEDEGPSGQDTRIYLAKDKTTKWFKVKGRTALRTRSHNLSLKLLVQKTPDEKLARRRRALVRFRGVVRLVIANLYWMGELDEMRIGDNVMKNIQLLTRKKIKKSSLTIQEKAIMCKPKEERTDEEKVLLNKVIGGLKCFRRYPPDVKSQLAAVTYFCFISPGRQIVKQDHDPLAMYFILSGEAAVTVRHFDKLLQEWVDVDSGTIGPGTMFGEVALIHGIVRLATITTITPCELLMIKKEDFDLVLKETVLKAWEEIQKIMNQFSYFKNWDAVTKRECSIMSRTKVFAPDETVLGDEAGLSNYVYFLTKGTCCIIEHLMLKVFEVNGCKKYKLYKPEVKKEEPDGSSIAASAIIMKYLGNPDTDDASISPKEVDPRQSVKGTDTPISTFSKQLAGSITQNDIKWKLETHFIQVCELTEGACFNICENFKRRRVVAKTPTNCLLVPRYWILKNNKDNIWNRVQQFLNTHIPTTEQIFKHFLEQKKFLKYRKRLVDDILAQKKVANDNTIHNVPYSIRLREGIEDLI